MKGALFAAVVLAATGLLQSGYFSPRGESVPLPASVAVARHPASAVAGIEPPQPGRRSVAQAAADGRAVPAADAAPGAVVPPVRRTVPTTPPASFEASPAGSGKKKVAKVKDKPSGRMGAATAGRVRNSAR